MKIFGVLSAGTALFVGCSLTGITDVRVGECESDQSCREVLNPEEGNYPECASYECVNNGDYNQCQKIEGERLDGLDNDCDFLVDESDGSNGGGPRVDTDGVFANGIPNASSASLAFSEALSQVYVQQRGGTAFAVEVEGGEGTAVGMVAQAIDDSTTQNFVIDLTDGCFTPTSSQAQDCDINEAVAAAGSSLGYFAQVKTAGCADGELRVGAIDPSQPHDFIDRGPGFRNPTYRGVATYGSLCSDNGRKACSDAKADFAALVEAGAPASERESAQSIISSECGVSRPAIAATDKQALVTFLGAKLGEEICGGDPVDIFGLMLHERIKSFGEEFAWADPSGDGVPDKLGTTTSGRPPAIHAVPGAGFLFAHGDEDGEISLNFLPLLDDPPGNSGTECPDDDCESRDGFETESIDGVENLATISSGGHADGIRLSWLSVGDEEAAVAVTWVDGCADEDDTLSDLEAFVMVIRLDLSDSIPKIVWQGQAISLGRTKSAPLAVPSAQDFVVAGFERGERTASNEDTTGFYVLTRPTSIQAVRVAAFDGQQVVTDEVIPVAAASFRYLTALGEGTPDQVVLSQIGEGTLTRGVFVSGDSN